MVWDDNNRVVTPEHYERTFANMYNVLKMHVIRLLNTFENREYNHVVGNPYMKVHSIMGSPVISALTYQENDILYKDGLVINGGIVCYTGGWKKLKNEDLLDIYKILYGLVINGVL